MTAFYPHFRASYRSDYFAHLCRAGDHLYSPRPRWAEV